MLLAACGAREGQGGGAPGAGAGAPPPAEVSVITVTQGAATLTSDLPGRLEAYRIAQVRARVDGIVERRLFTEGSDVRGGDTLFQIDARTYRTAYESAKIDADVARQTLERYKPLLEARAVSQQDYDLANAKVKQAEAALAKAALDIENCRVPAPISGRIGRALVTEGALVGHGDATNLATIQQIDPIYANFTQPGADLSRLQKAIAAGQLKHATSTEVELVLEDGSIYPQKGKLLFSDIAVDPGTGSVSIRATFPNPRKELLPGMFAMVRLPQAISDDAIRLPQRAVMVGPQGQFVLAVDAENKVVPRPVKTVAMAGGDFIVGSGVAPGDLVIVDGVQKARPGSVVKPVPLEVPDNAAQQGAPAPAQVSPEKK
jgi:membrane fusion protein (multidrug efflux system)